MGHIRHIQMFSLKASDHLHPDCFAPLLWLSDSVPEVNYWSKRLNWTPLPVRFFDSHHTGCCMSVNPCMSAIPSVFQLALSFVLRQLSNYSNLTR